MVNNMTTNVPGQMGDKEYINDSIYSQKMISSNYNTFANECVNPALRTDFLNILNEEHQIQSELSDEMQKRGWYQVMQADTQQVTKARDKFKL